MLCGLQVFHCAGELGYAASYLLNELDDSRVWLVKCEPLGLVLPFGLFAHAVEMVIELTVVARVSVAQRHEVVQTSAGKPFLDDSPEE